MKERKKMCPEKGFFLCDDVWFYFIVAAAAAAVSVIALDYPFDVICFVFKAKQNIMDKQV